MLAKVAYISAYHANPLVRQRANGILRKRYAVAIRPRDQRDPAWLSAHSM